MSNHITQIFKDAIKCQDQTQQFQMMSQGCKLITDSIKDPDLFQIVAAQQNLVKYMIQSISIFGQNIDYILESTLEFYHTNQTYMLNFWSSLGQLAQISDSEVKMNSKSNLLNLTQKFLQNHYQQTNDIIIVKEKTLHYINLFIGYIGKNKTILQNINIFSIFFIIIQNTESERIINLTCKILDQSRQMYGYQCFKSDIYNQIEEYLIKKYTQQSQQDTDILTDNLNPNNFKQKQIMIDTSRKIKKSIPHKEIQQNNTDFDDLQEYNTNHDIIKIQQVKNLEIWLTSKQKDKLYINQSEFIQSFLKEEENFFIYLNFFMDPFMNISSQEVCNINKKFKQFVQNLNLPEQKFENTRNLPLFRQHKNFLPNYLKVYIYRSYKVLISFLDSHNYQKLQKLQPNITQLFFKNLYNTIQKTEDKPYDLNTNHIIKALYHIILKSDMPTINIAVLEFCKNNFVFKLIEYLDYSSVELFLLDILGVTNNCIFGNYQYKFLKYLQTTSFFCDLSRIMINQDTTNIIQKFDNNYMMTDIKIDLRSEKMSQQYSQLYQKQKIMNYSNKAKQQIKSYLIYEDFDLWKKDIDMMYKISCIHAKKILQTKDCYDSYEKIQKTNTNKKYQELQKKISTIEIQPNCTYKVKQTMRQRGKKRNIQQVFQSLRKYKGQINFMDKKIEKQDQTQQKYKKREDTQEIIQNINIYPYHMSEISFCQIEFKQKQLFCDMKNILKIEPYSLICANIFQTCIFKEIQNQQQQKNEKQNLLLQAIFKQDNSIVYRDILENYLFKFDLNQQENYQNSSKVCGNIVNKILMNLNLFQEFDIQEISFSYFLYINKLIVKCMQTFNTRKIIQTQALDILGNFRTTRLQLIETFYLMLKISNPSQKLISKVYIPTWDCIITLFFEFRMNSIYHTLFLKIMRLVAERADDNLLFQIFVKLNLFSRMVQTFQSIYQNNVLLTDNHVDEQFISIIQLSQMFVDNKKRFNDEALNKINFWTKLNDIVRVKNGNSQILQPEQSLKNSRIQDHFKKIQENIHTVI